MKRGQDMTRTGTGIFSNQPAGGPVPAPATGRPLPKPVGTAPLVAPRVPTGDTAKLSPGTGRLDAVQEEGDADLEAIARALPPQPVPRYYARLAEDAASGLAARGVPQERVDEVRRELPALLYQVARMPGNTAAGVSGPDAALRLSDTIRDDFDLQRLDDSCVPAVEAEYLLRNNPMAFARQVQGMLQGPPAPPMRYQDGYIQNLFQFSRLNEPDPATPGGLRYKQDPATPGVNLAYYAQRTGMPYLPKGLAPARFAAEIDAHPEGVAISLDPGGKHKDHCVLLVGGTRPDGTVAFIDPGGVFSENPAVVAGYDELGRPLVRLAELQLNQGDNADSSRGGAGYTWHKP